MNNPSTPKNHRILIVDDNRAIHDDFRKILSPLVVAAVAALDATEAALFGAPAQTAQPLAYEIDSAYQGLEGVAMVQRALAEGRPYAMAFVDVRMPPGIDGVETTQKIWAADPEVQIVLCTAYSDYSWDEMFAKIGNSDGLLILKKPFDAVEVFQLAHTLTEKWGLHRLSQRKMEELEQRVAARTGELQQTNLTLKTEIAGHQRAAATLLESRRFLQSTLNALSAHIAILDEHGKIIEVNAAWNRFARENHFTGSHGVGDNYLNICTSIAGIFSEAACAVAEGIRSVMTGNRAEFHLEYPCHSPSAKRWFVVRATRFDGDGPVRVVVAHENITERKRLEVQLLQSQKLETVGQLAAGIAHEINTPTQYVGDNTRFVKDSFGTIANVLQAHAALLAAVKQNAVTPALLAQQAELLAASDLDYLCEQIPSALKQTLEGVERVSKIVRAMKEFSHSGGKEKTPADLNRAIESTVTVAHNEWKYVADLKTDLAADLPLVPCFVGEFNQCILNLIVNAAHAIGDVVGENPGTKGLITVQTRRDGDQVEVRVTDTGTGIPEVARPKIFEPFFTTKDVGKGTGQGLSIIYGSIVKRHGGTVTFETETGRGTTFIIRLPINLKAAPEAGQPQPRELQAA